MWGCVSVCYHKLSVTEAPALHITLLCPICLHGCARLQLAGFTFPPLFLCRWPRAHCYKHGDSACCISAINRPPGPVESKNQKKKPKTLSPFTLILSITAANANQCVQTHLGRVQPLILRCSVNRHTDSGLGAMLICVIGDCFVTSPLSHRSLFAVVRTTWRLWNIWKSSGTNQVAEREATFDPSGQRVDVTISPTIAGNVQLLTNVWFKYKWNADYRQRFCSANLYKEITS